MNVNSPTARELADISTIALTLNDLMDRLIERGSTVQFGNVRLFDSNGEEVGWLVSDDELSGPRNWFVYKGEDDDE